MHPILSLKGFLVIAMVLAGSTFLAGCGTSISASRPSATETRATETATPAQTPQTVTQWLTQFTAPQNNPYATGFLDSEKWIAVLKGSAFTIQFIDLGSGTPQEKHSEQYIERTTVTADFTGAVGYIDLDPILAIYKVPHAGTSQHDVVIIEGVYDYDHLDAHRNPAPELFAFTIQNIDGRMLVLERPGDGGQTLYPDYGTFAKVMNETIIPSREQLGAFLIWYKLHDLDLHYDLNHQAATWLHNHAQGINTDPTPPYITTDLNALLKLSTDKMPEALDIVGE